MIRLLFILAGLVLAFAATPVFAQTADVVGAIYAAAQNHHVPAQPLVDLARCETGGTFDATARGDFRYGHPTSFGAYQLSSLSTGLLGHFTSLGYDNPDDPEEAADYVARVYSGEFTVDGITLRRWTCWT